MSIRGIYKITSPNGKVYIGQSKDIYSRWASYKTVKCKDQKRLYNSFTKYGVDNHTFEIVHILPKDSAQTVIDDYEIFYMKIYREAGFSLLNIKDGGSYGSHSKESIELMKLIGKQNMERMKQDKEKFDNWLIKISEAKKDKPKSDIHKKNIGLALKGKPTGRKGIKLTEEHKEKLRKAKLGGIQSLETNNKRSETMKQYWINKKLKNNVYSCE